MILNQGLSISFNWEPNPPSCRPKEPPDGVGFGPGGAGVAVTESKKASIGSGGRPCETQMARRTEKWPRSKALWEGGERNAAREGRKMDEVRMCILDQTTNRC